jgi:hypothetical protein
MAKTRTKRRRQPKAQEAGGQPSQEMTQAINEQPAAVQPSAPAAKSLHELLEGRPVYVNSIAAGLLELGQESILREMDADRYRMLRFYLGPRGGSLPLDEAVKTVNGPQDDAEADKLLAQLLSGDVTQVSWYALQQLHNYGPKIAKQIWRLVKKEARREFESGHRAAQAFEPTHWLREPWKRAQYLALRESFIAQWRPQGGVELAMIDSLAISYYLYLYWTEVSVTRTETEARPEPPEWVRERACRDRSFPRERLEGYWDPPYAKDVEAVEHAAEMADRYLRAFQRTLRAMRDLRRYSTPVTINNPQQVNIAAEGGQQVNAIIDKKD